MVRTRRGSGVENVVNEGLGTSKRKYSRNNLISHPLSAPQLIDPKPGCLLSNVLKHHGNSKLAYTSERAPRRAIQNWSSYQSEHTEDNTARNSSYFQHAQLQDGTLPNAKVEANIHVPVTQSPATKDLKMHPLLAPEQGRHPDVGDAMVPSEQESTPLVGDMSGGSTVFHLLGSNMCPNSNLATVGADNVTSEVNTNQQVMECDHLVTSASHPTKSLNMTEIAEQTHINDGDEVDSISCDSILVGGYRIRPQYVDICNLILSKHGDIAAQCSEKLVIIKSFYVEYICTVVQKLQNSDFVSISRKELEEMLSHLSYFEGQGVNVSWLKKPIQIIYKANLAVSMLRPSSDAKQLVQAKKSNIQRTKNELEVYQAELANLKEKINAANIILSEEEKKLQETQEMLSDYKANLKYVHNEFKPLVQSLT